ncbi:MAG: class I adenylate-forming enzyme family protein [Thermoanaerobaculia bacterium]
MTADGGEARLRASLDRHAARPAVEFHGRVFRYDELDRLASRFAAGLLAYRVSPGDAVAVRAESCPEAAVSLLGNLGAGAIHVPLNPAFTNEESRHILTDSGARLVVAPAGAECPYERHVSFEDVLSAGTAATGHLPEPDPDAIALLLYTSGTTGRSKGVELSVRAVFSNLGSVARLWRISESDRVVVALPLFHVHGLGLGVVGSLLSGATILLEEQFDAGAVVKAFEARRATVFMGVPTMYIRLLEHLEKVPAAADALSKGRLFTAGSAPLSTADLSAFLAATGQTVLERYGMTETLFTLSNPYDGERRSGSVGRPVPGCEIRIVDDDRKDVPDGTPGDLLVRSSGLMTRYRNSPEETAAAMQEGWFVTGDVASRSADGYVTLHGRKSVDFIKSGGYRISTREIEDVLSRHPDVREVAVVGLPDRVWGQRVAAAVIPAPGASYAGITRALRRLATEGLAPYKQPREIVLMSEFPRTPLGKVQKNALAAEIAEKARLTGGLR